MNRHLTDEEVLDLLAPGVEADPAAREHLAACDLCRARIESERPLSERVASLPDAADPTRLLWPSLRARLEAEPLNLPRPAPRRTALQAAAAIIVFLLGVVAGHALQSRPDDTARLDARDPLAAAAEVQRTGTAYVEAVARFRTVAADSAPGAVEQAREVALAAVHGAAFELARLHPEDATAREILALARDRRPAEGAR